MRDYSRAEIDRLGSRLRKMARSEGEDISLYVGLEPKFWRGPRRGRIGIGLPCWYCQVNRFGA